MLGEEEAVAEAVATVAAAEVEAEEVRTTPVLAPVAESAEVRTTPVLALVAESKAYVPHLARTCSTTDRRRPPIR